MPHPYDVTFLKLNTTKSFESSNSFPKTNSIFPCLHRLVSDLMTDLYIVKVGCALQSFVLFRRPLWWPVKQITTGRCNCRFIALPDLRKVRAKHTGRRTLDFFIATPILGFNQNRDRRCRSRRKWIKQENPRFMWYG